MKRSSPGDVRDASSGQLLESLSALMDDEADDLEIRRLVKGVSENPELADRWRRYHAVRASLLQETHVVPSVDLRSGIKAKLNAEEVARPAGAFGGRFARLMGQGAIAASVAGAVLLGYPLLQTADSGSGSEGSALVAEQTEAPAVSVDMPVLTGDYTASPLTRTVSLDAAARDRLQQVVYEFSGTPAVLNSTAPMFPAQLAPIDSEEQAEQGAK